MGLLRIVSRQADRERFVRWGAPSTLLIALLLSAAPALPSEPGCADGTEGLAEIRGVFDAYKSALIAGDGASAASLIDAGTLDYFERLRRQALEGDEDSLRASSFVDRLLVVSMRHVLSAEELRELTFEELIDTAVAQGWIQAPTLASLAMGEPSIDGEIAVAAPLGPSAAPEGEAEPGAMVAPAELSYRFVCEDGAWKFQFGSLVTQLNALVSELTRQLGTEEDVLIFALVEAFSGRKVLPEVWSRPAADDPTDSEPPPRR